MSEVIAAAIAGAFAFVAGLLVAQIAGVRNRGHICGISVSAEHAEIPCLATRLFSLRPVCKRA